MRRLLQLLGHFRTEALGLLQLDTKRPILVFEPCADLLVALELVCQHLYLLAEVLNGDDALVQGLACGLQPFDFDILILSGDVSFIKLLVDFDVRK